MPRVSTQKARKDYPANNIKAGDIYYKWKFRYGPVMRSATYPKLSQLTQSEYKGQAFDLIDRLNDLSSHDLEDVQGMVEEIACEIRELGEEQNERKENMPESLQYSPTAELLEERYEACESAASELEQIDFPDKPDEPCDPGPFNEPEPSDEDEETYAEWEAMKQEHDELVEEFDKAQEEMDEWDTQIHALIDEAASAADEIVI